jgi:hypothetical protein
MPTPQDIDQAISIGSFGANLEWYCLQLSTIGVTFEGKKISRFFLSALQGNGMEVDRFVDRLDNVADADPLPYELTLTELILCIKDIHSVQNSTQCMYGRWANLLRTVNNWQYFFSYQDICRMRNMLPQPGRS